jgi:hypothetical protein
MGDRPEWVWTGYCFVRCSAIVAMQVYGNGEGMLFIPGNDVGGDGGYGIKAGLAESVRAALGVPQEPTVKESR